MASYLTKKDATTLYDIAVGRYLTDDVCTSMMKLMLPMYGSIDPRITWLCFKTYELSNSKRCSYSKPYYTGWGKGSDSVCETKINDSVDDFRRIIDGEVPKEMHSKIKKIVTEIGTGYHGYTMSRKWKSPTTSQVFTVVRVQMLNSLTDLAEKPRITGRDIFALIDAVSFLLDFLKLDRTPMAYVKDGSTRGKKAKVKAIWANKLDAERKLLHPRLHSSTECRKAINLTGVLMGRLHNMLNHAMPQECAKLDKHGIFELPEFYDTATVVWCLIMKSQLDARKAFTLEKQMQGGLTTLQKVFLDEYLMKQDSTDFKLIAMLYPVPRIIERLTMDEKKEMYDNWLSKLHGMAYALQIQWNAGVNTTASNNWIFPAQGSGVKSDLWNTVAGAWNNCIRHVRILACALGLSMPPLIFSVPKMIAYDQYRWSQDDFKLAKSSVTNARWNLIRATVMKNNIDVVQNNLNRAKKWLKDAMLDPKADVIADLVHDGILPWSGLNGMENSTILTKIVMYADKHSVPLHRFLGLPQERADVMRVQYNMICGVAVDCTQDVADMLVEHGAFGSKTAQQ